MFRKVLKMMTKTENKPEVQTEPKGKLTTRTLAMPGDANPSGDIFGGWVLSQMDIAAGICAVDRCKGRAVTIAVDAMTFIEPVNVGDVICVYSRIEKEGRTSMSIHLEAWVRRQRMGDRVKVTDGIFTFVSLDENGKPKPLPTRQGYEGEFVYS